MFERKSSQNQVPEQKRRATAGSFIWKLLKMLPYFLRAPIVRRLVTVPYESDNEIIFKRAESYSEIEQALRIVYDAYKERGLTDDSSSQLRVTKYHALPTTAVLIAIKDNEVIATMSLVLDSSLGLPLEAIWNINHIRNTSRRMAEVSSLAIKKGHRSQRGKILLPLCNFMYRYAKQHLGVDVLFAAVHPNVQDFYRSILLFSPVDDYKVHSYSFAQGALAVAQYLRLDGSEVENYKKTYSRKSPQHNIYNYFMIRSKFDNFKFPMTEYYKAGNITLSPGHLDYLFKNCSSIFSELTPKERAALNNIYFLNEYTSVIGTVENTPNYKNRSHPRFAVMLNCRLRGSQRAEILPGTCLEVSRQGLNIQINHEFFVSTNDSIEVSAMLGPNLTCSLTCKVIWVSTSKKLMGLEIVKEKGQVWKHFINSLEEELYRQAQARLSEFSTKNKDVA
jgi:hypothetical protein